MKRKYVIWAWKGDYLNLGAGCEVGFYNTYGSTKHYFFVKKIFTELEMRYNGNLINNYRPPKSKEKKWGIHGGLQHLMLVCKIMSILQRLDSDV